VAVAALVAMIGGAGSASAQGANKAAEFAIKYRQALYTTMYGNFGPLGAMVKGTMPFDANVFKTKAERVAYLSVMAAEAFPAESQSGAPTEAKPDIWTNRAEFDKLMKDWQTKAATLAKVSRSGKLETIKPAFLEVGGACKACHDKFREEEKKK
jgi:cytochrome c556